MRFKEPQPLKHNLQTLNVIANMSHISTSASLSRLIAMLFAIIALSACDNNDELLLNEHKSNFICMEIKPTSMSLTRTLIVDDNALKQACSQSGGNSIGIWSAYTLDGVVTNNVLGNEHGDVSLVYREDTAWDNYQFWTYGETAAQWVLGAAYTFNAYYPMDAVDEITTSDVSTFVIGYNTELRQDDLMTAYAYVDTKASSFIMSNPVQLKMLHTLSALRFQFTFINSDGSTYYDNDALTSCWLENTQSGHGIATTGILAFGTINEDGTMNGESIHWYHEDHPEPSTATTIRKIYAWDDSEGVAFSSTATSSTTATAYSTNNDGLQKYADNDGWILTIPQAVDGSTQLCFRLKSTGSLTHRINIPATTYEAGKRYTYDIHFGQSSATITLKITDWNNLKSTHDIPL